jgi:TolA-binding protein
MRRLSGFGWLLLTALTAAPRILGAADAAEEALTDEEVVVKTEGGGVHRLMLPKDWPVEQERPGLVRPAPIEVYLSMKFGQVREALNTVDRQLAALEERVRELEDGQTALALRMQALEEREQRRQQKEARDGDATPKREAAQGAPSFDSAQDGVPSASRGTPVQP